MPCVCVIPVADKILVETFVQYFIGDALNLSLDKCTLYSLYRRLGIVISIKKM
jgi:hypothetical protein